MSERKRLCVYSHSANGQIFYVGSGEPGRRPYERHGRTPRWLSHIKRCGGYEIKIHAWADNRAEVQRIEGEMIAAHNPSCNVLKVTARNEKAPATKTAFQFVRLAPAAKAALEKAARDDERPVATLAQKIITDWLKERKYLK